MIQQEHVYCGERKEILEGQSERSKKERGYADVEADKLKMLTSGLQDEGLEIW